MTFVWFALGAAVAAWAGGRLDQWREAQRAVAS